MESGGLMNTQHTPGPWTPHFAANAVTYTVNVGDSPELLRSRDGFSVEVYGSNVKADIRLIAAAPELLAALRNALADLEQFGDRFCDVVDAARAAIAKAEGTECSICRRVHGREVEHACE
jgi:hypothetical protein